MNFQEITTKLGNNELALGQKFKTDSGRELYVGKASALEIPCLKWSVNDEIIKVTSVLANTKFTQIDKFKQITIATVFELLSKGEEVYYSVKTDEKYKVSNIPKVDGFSIFERREMPSDVSFYRKES